MRRWRSTTTTAPTSSRRYHELTGGAGVDVVYDPVGGDILDQSRRTVGWNGRYLVIGFTSGRIPDVPANHVLLKNYSVVGVHWGAAVAREPGPRCRAPTASCSSSTPTARSTR